MERRVSINADELRGVVPLSRLPNGILRRVLNLRIDGQGDSVDEREVERRRARQRVNSRRYRAKHPGKHSAVVKAYRARNPGKMKYWKRKWRDENRVAFRAMKRRNTQSRRASNPEHHRQLNATWWALNKERINAARRARRGNRRGV